MTRVLLLLPTTTYHARDFLEAAARLGVEAVVGSDVRQALEDLQPARTLTLDLDDPTRAAERIVAFAADHPLAAVIPTDDASAVVAATASERLGLPHNPPDASAAARRKDRLRQRLGAAGIRTPRHTVLSVDDDPVAAARGRTPVVLKPVFLAASRGVIRADDAPGFAAAFRRITALLADPDVAARGGEAARLVLVEEFVAGAEVAVEGILTRGRLDVLALFDKPDPLDGPFFEETLYVTPSRHPPAAQEGIRATTAAAAEAVGLRHGPIHAELRLDPRDPARPWLIEIAARTIGGLCSRSLRFGTGLSLEDVVLMHALGRDVAGLKREGRAAGVMMIPIPRAGVLKDVRGLEEARAVPGIEEITISATRGRPLVPLPEGSAYLGFIFARATTPRDAEAALRDAHARLRFDIDDRPASTVPPRVP